MCGNFVHATNDASHYTKPPKRVGFSDMITYNDMKELQRSPAIGRGLNARGVAKNSDFGPIEGSQKRFKIEGDLVLITNRKSYMSFRLVPKSVTLNDLERRNGLYFALFHQIRARCRRKTIITSVSKSTFDSHWPY